MSGTQGMNITPAQRHFLSWIALAALGFALLWLLGPVLVPFVVAAVLAYALHPVVERLVAFRLPRALAVILVETGLILALLAMGLLLVPVLLKEIPVLQQRLPQWAAQLNQWLGPWLAHWGIPVSIDPDAVKAFALKYVNANFEEGLLALLNSARIGGSALLALLGQAILVPVVLFYLLMDWTRSVARVGGLVPRRFRPLVKRFVMECDAVLAQYLRGQLAVMLALGVYYALALALFGLDLALPVGLFTGLAVFIPYLGFGLGLCLALFAGLLEFGLIKALVMVGVVYGLGQLIESFFLTPRLVGERIGLSPLAVIFSLLAFGHIFGFVGVLVALPVSAVALVAGKRALTAYKSSELYQG
jgi:predicted PurR-regulated permease PerM